MVSGSVLSRSGGLSERVTVGVNYEKEYYDEGEEKENDRRLRLKKEWTGKIKREEKEKKFGCTSERVCSFGNGNDPGFASEREIVDPFGDKQPGGDRGNLKVNA